MTIYEKKALHELKAWQVKMQKKPSIVSRLTKGVQEKANGLMPEKAHVAITEVIKNMVKVVLAGSKLTTRKPLVGATLEKREKSVQEKLEFYRKSALLSGAGTGAGGFLVGLADFPMLVSLKMKFLFDAASLYGFDVKDYRERLYILHVFQLAFSSQEKRREVYFHMAEWETYVKRFPKSMENFDWRSFQQEYRDYIDLAKMLQLVPGIGAVVGAYANSKLMRELGDTARNAYRMRLLNSK